MFKTGNWNGLLAAFSGADKILEKNIKKEGRNLSQKIRTSMITGITTKRFNLAPNAESTIAQKGSSTPLVDKGDLVGSINVHKLEDGSGFLIGANRKAKNKAGDSIVNIWAINHYGVGHKYEDGTTIKTVGSLGVGMYIPARDAITPAVEENKGNFLRAGQNAMADTIAEMTGKIR